METERNERRYRGLLERSLGSARQFRQWIRLSCSGRQRERQREEIYLIELFDRLMTYPPSRRRVDYILAVDENDSRIRNLVQGDGRALPGRPEFLESGWATMMLTRYALGMHHSRGKVVLDSCSGLGWGSYLVDLVARHVIAVDVDRATLECAQSLWPSHVTDYVQASVLTLCLDSASVDVALAMESIEHFRLPDIHVYLDELKRVLRPGGMLVGSSAFPGTRKMAQALCARNPHHLHICTKNELMGILRSRFRRSHVCHNGLFFWAEK